MKDNNNLFQKIKLFDSKPIISISLLGIGGAVTLGDTSHIEIENQLSEEMVTLQASQDELLNTEGFKEFLAIEYIDKEIEEFNVLNQSYIDEKD